MRQIQGLVTLVGSVNFKAGSQYTLLWCNSVQSGTSHKTVDAPTLANAGLENNSIPAALL